MIGKSTNQCKLVPFTVNHCQLPPLQSCNAVEAKKKDLRNVTKHLVIPKAVVPKKESGTIRNAVRNHINTPLKIGARGNLEYIRPVAMLFHNRIYHTLYLTSLLHITRSGHF